MLKINFKGEVVNLNPNVNIPESLANVAPVILGEALEIWRGQTPLLSAGVVTDYSSDLAEKGEAVDLPDVQPMEAFDIVPDPNLVPESEKPDVENRRIVLDQHKGASFNLTQAEYATIEQGKVIPGAVTRAAEALVKQVNEAVSVDRKFILERVNRWL
ncbi:hypothetical protein [Egbenema bharatensis]|uniref:hypothetical protein n=1 Tax=Egbenema bharatensis TaxID=3463334 RepID=UPI003A893F96